MFLSPFIHKFRNNEFIQFIKNVLNVVQHHDPEKLNVKAAYDNLNRLSDQISALYKPELGSDITQELEELDERRDRAFNGIFKYVDAFTNHFEEEKCDAAAELYDAILLFGGGIARLNYQAETSTISSIINRFRSDTNLTTAVSKLSGLDEWLNELEEANQMFDKAYMMRVREEANKPGVKMAEIRKEMTGVFRSLLKHLEAHAIISGDELYDQVAKEINEVIENYNQLVVNRSSSTSEPEEEVQ